MTDTNPILNNNYNCFLKKFIELMLLDYSLSSYCLALRCLFNYTLWLHFPDFSLNELFIPEITTMRRFLNCPDSNVSRKILEVTRCLRCNFIVVVNKITFRNTNLLPQVVCVEQYSKRSIWDVRARFLYKEFSVYY